MGSFWAFEYVASFICLFVVVLMTLVYLREHSRIHAVRLRKDDWTPSVSIIIPAYNESAYIAGCIRSVLALDYPKNKLEIIVVDDGSTDGTAAIARSFCEKNPHLRVWSKPNSGKADSMNRAIARAKGEMVACLDADSYVSHYSLRRMLAHFDAPEVAAVASAVKIRKAHNLVEEVQRIEYLYYLFTRRILNALNCVTVTPGPFSIFRRKIFLEVGGFDRASLVEDQEIALRLQKAGYRINSSLDTDIYTEAPHNFLELLKQRTRWQRGGFWNSMKYLDLIHPRYGDLGLIIIPFGVVGYLLFIGGMFVFADSMLNRSPYEGLVGWQSFFLGLGPMQVLVAVWFIFAFSWFIFGVRPMFRQERISLPSIALFLFLSPIFSAVFWVSAAYTEIRTGGRFAW